MKRGEFDNCLASMTENDAAEGLGIDLERYRARTRARARKNAGGFSAAVEPLAYLELAMELMESDGAEVGAVVAKVLGELLQKAALEAAPCEKENELVGTATGRDTP